MYELWNINPIRQSGWYIAIRVWIIDNDKIVIESGKKVTICDKFKINVKKLDR
jgi:hypothetical protein